MTLSRTSLALAFLALLAACRTTGPALHTDTVAEPGRTTAAMPWPNGRIPYVIDESLRADSAVITRVMHRWENGTPIRFTPRLATDSAYVQVRAGDCTTYDRGATTVVEADSACVGHELGHAIGLRHEHQRSDRDRYVTIRKPTWYWRHTPQYSINDLPLCRPYDLGSIMHYGITVVTPRPGYEITRRDNEPSAADLLSVRQLYGDAPCEPQPANP